MAKISKEKREAILRKLWREGFKLLKASGGRNYAGFTREMNAVYHPRWIHMEDLLTICTTDEDTFVANMMEKYEKWIQRHAPFGEVHPLPVNNTPIEEILPGFENEPRQTSIDFETEAISDNIGQLILEVRRVAEALEKLAVCVTEPVYNSPYINIRQQS